MDEEFEKLIRSLEGIDGVTILDMPVDYSHIHLSITRDDSIKAISSQVSEVREYYGCSLLVMTKAERPAETTYQIVFEKKDREAMIRLLRKKLDNLKQSDGSLVKAKYRELGLPDMSLLTIRQMAAELKRRDGLTFALVWIENAERDNIAIEGSGNPTQLVGLLTRGSHMAIEWADKNIKFFKPREDD
jgi:hypothetical protein